MGNLQWDEGWNIYNGVSEIDKISIWLSIGIDKNKHQDIKTKTVLKDKNKEKLNNTVIQFSEVIEIVSFQCFFE